MPNETTPPPPAQARRTVAYASAAGYALGALRGLGHYELPADARTRLEAAVQEVEAQLRAIEEME